MRVISGKYRGLKLTPFDGEEIRPTADRVKGIPIRTKSRVLTSYPSFRRMPMPAMLAEAPMGVQLPPSVAPDSRPK